MSGILQEEKDSGCVSLPFLLYFSLDLAIPSTHDEVFSDIRQSPVTVSEAAEYLEVAEITIRRWVRDGSLKSERLGKNIVFDADYLKNSKKQSS